MRTPWDMRQEILKAAHLSGTHVIPHVTKQGNQKAEGLDIPIDDPFRGSFEILVDPVEGGWKWCLSTRDYRHTSPGVIQSGTNDVTLAREIGYEILTDSREEYDIWTGRKPE